MTMGQAFQKQALSWREVVLGALCSILPDLDVIGFRVGIQYGDVWGHRGLTHSLMFAALLSGTLVAVCYRRKPAVAITGRALYFFLCAASHGVLDAMTNGGLGVAFFSPFDTTRYFFPLRPLVVFPIGVGNFFSEYGVQVLVSEAAWIWLPSCAAYVTLRAVQKLWSSKSVAAPS